MSLLISANGALALQKTIDVEKNKVIYIGDITATIVEKKDNEKSVGPAIPLIDQRVAGFSNGTFVVNVKDNFDQDVALLKKTYPGRSFSAAPHPDRSCLSRSPQRCRLRIQQRVGQSME